MDIVIVRENEEDVYGGIEHRQTNQMAQCLKLISRPGSKSIIRYAFEYAHANKRKKVTCFTKDNIMKITDGLFHRIFDEIARRVPGHRERALDRRHRRRQDGRHARSVRRHRDAESLRRRALRRRRADHGLGGPGGLREYRRPLLDVRGDPRLRAAPRGPEPRQPVRLAARRDPDARAHRSGRRRRARPQRAGCGRSKTASTRTTSSRKARRARRSARASSPTRSSSGWTANRST